MFYCQPKYVFVFLFPRYYRYWLAYPSIWTLPLLHELHHLWLTLSLIFRMGMLKISYIWSWQGLLPGPLYLLLCLSQHTLLHELEGSLQLPKYHWHIHIFVSFCSKSYSFVLSFYQDSIFILQSPSLNNLSTWQHI